MGRATEAGTGQGTPLRTELLFILLVLQRGVRHGYALLEEVARESGGDVQIQTGSLYRFLGQLLDDDLIDEVDAPAGERSADERRRYYGLTERGRAIVKEEVSRLRRLAEAAEALRRGRRARRA